ncbi:transposase [Okeania sp. SIO2B9]|nr:transposase [Okeania sp. SIO2B9]
MANRRLTFRLYPTKVQKEKLFLVRKLHQLLYNACVAHRRFEWRKNRSNVDYFTQQNALPGFRQQWSDYQQLNLSSLQATVKRVDLAYNAFFKGIRKRPKFKSIRNYSGWTYPDGRQGFKVQIEKCQKYSVNCGWVTLNDLGMRLRMRGRFKYWGKPTTCTIVYRPHKDEWYVSFSIKTSEPLPLFGSKSPLDYESMVAFDLGTQTALTCYDGYGFDEISNPRFDREFAPKIQQASRQLKRKQGPIKGKQKASSRWKKAKRKISKLKAKQSAVRQDWQHKVTTDIASCYDIVVTEKLNVKGMTRKAKTGKRSKQKAGLNRSLLDVGFGTLNQMVLYKILGKGGLHITIDTRRVKPSQRCPSCGTVHKEWAQLSNRYHVCDDCGFEVPRDQGSVMVMWNVAADRQPGLGTGLVNRRCSSSTDSTRKHTGSMRQLGQMKRSKSQSADFVDGDLETPSVYTAG